MWLLLAISIFIIIFILANRKEHQDSQEEPEQELQESRTQDHASSHNHNQDLAQEKKMQIHSVVTDVVHPENPVSDQDDLDKYVSEDPKATKDESTSETSIDQKSTEMSDFTSHLSMLKLEFDLFHEWQLFSSKAAIFWHPDNPLVTILCLSHFVKGEAKSLIYKEYKFNTDSWSWQGASPKGAASEVKKKLSETFKEQAKK
ncbi:hypothetical protein [Marinomonas sp. PE14-40]|uniref:hypothetical protein n=1 Tax=Marinomonas sp. PE14-40 TaxID=3060621 RepID=UPI003F6815F9